MSIIEPEPTSQPGRSEVALLTLLIFCLVAIPSRLVFAPLGGAGTPAQLVGLLLVLRWTFLRLSGRLAKPATTALRCGMYAVLVSVVMSYAQASLRPIPPIEVRSADRALLGMVSWLGMFLITCDGPRTREQLDTVLRRLCVAVGAMGLLGIMQFATGLSFTNYIQIPGLSVNSELQSILGRGGLTRPAGTATHPIEFGAVLTLMLPLALHYALTDGHRRLFWRWAPVATIAIAIPISISRSALIGAAISLAFVIPTWPRRTRRRCYAALAALGVGLYLSTPGLLGTLTGLFTGISQDSSASSRTDSYAMAVQFISRYPVFGRGFGTFLPSYRILDNQYLHVLIETGVVGLVALLGLIASALRAAALIRRRCADEATRSLVQALAAGVASASASFALYDAFSFPMAASLFFLFLGAIGAAARFQAQAVPDPAVAAGSGREDK